MAAMFTGIVEEAGTVVGTRATRRSSELAMRARVVGRGTRVGDSIAVNGACLTVVAARNGVLKFDVLEETLHRTNLGSLRRGDLVNLERPLRVGDRLGGHYVLGHVDGRGTVRRFEKQGSDYVFEIRAPVALMRHIVEKGSVAVDGISLTVAVVGRNWFRVWIIPHTRAVTNLSEHRVGDNVNIEVDILSKHVEKLVSGSGRR